MKRALPVLLTVGLIVIVGTLGLWRQRDGAPEPPEEAGSRLMSATRDGDVAAYLDCFTGALRAQIEATARDRGEAAFADYLRRQNAATTGVAWFPPADVSADEVEMKADFAFADGHQIRYYTLRRDGRRWRIAKILGEARQESIIPYGTPVGPTDLFPTEAEPTTTGVTP